MLLTEDKNKAGVVNHGGMIPAQTFHCTIDRKPHKTKPKGAAIGGIINRKKPERITLEDLGDILGRGGTFCPAVLEGTKQKDWKNQELLGLDIDNDHTEEPLALEDALAVLEKNYLRPAFCYYTFRSTDAKPKYRIIFSLLEPSDNHADIFRLTYRINSLLEDERPGCIDMCNMDFHRIFFGTDKPILWGLQFDPIDMQEALAFLPKAKGEDQALFEKLRTLKTPEGDGDIVPPELVAKIDELIKAEGLADAEKPAEASKLKESPTTARTATAYNLTQLEARLAADIENFDLKGYIRPSGRGPRYACPICGSSEGLHIKGHRWACHGTNHLANHMPYNGQKPGGDIIAYLQDLHKISKSEAFDMFKFDIMNYDRDEWKQAYKEKMDAEESARISAGLKANKEAREAAADASAAEGTETDATAEDRTTRTGAGIIDNLLTEANSETYKPISCGLTDLDAALDGGLIRQTLVLLGAAPGMGKTALCQYIAETMAENGRAVLYVNLEMSQAQLTARTLARLAWKLESISIKPTEVLRGYQWTDTKRKAITTAADYFRENIANNFIYAPDNQGADIVDILATMTKEATLAAEAGNPCPIIFIDYLQLITNDKEKGEDAAKLKKIIKALKDFAINHNTVVIAIMATNRSSNQAGKVSAESGRDTSAIEYSADVLLGMSYTAIENGETYEAGTNKDGSPKLAPWDLDAIRKAKTAYLEGLASPTARQVWEEITVRVNKNRFGTDGKRAMFIFEGKHNNFKQILKTKGDDFKPTDAADRVPFTHAAAGKGKKKPSLYGDTRA